MKTISVSLPDDMLNLILSEIPEKRLAQELLAALHDKANPTTTDRLLMQCLHHFVLPGS